MALVVVGTLSFSPACGPTPPVSSSQLPATTTPGANPSSDAKQSPQPSTSLGIVLGGELCVPSSPRIPSTSGIIGTVVGTTTADTQLFAAMHPLIQIGSEYKIIVRMTGSGSLETYAQYTDGTRLVPRTVEPHTLGSSFGVPGDEWGVFFTFPKAGCWQLHFARATGSGDIWFIASPKIG